MALTSKELGLGEKMRRKDWKVAIGNKEKTLSLQALRFMRW